MPVVFPEAPDPTDVREAEVLAEDNALYARTLPIWSKDRLFGFVGVAICDAIMGMLQGLDQIVADTPTHPGWTTILDPVACPEAWLPWCAQLYGVVLPPNSVPAEQRALILELPPQKRATIGALEAAVAQTLTGAKTVSVVERRPRDHPYHLAVYTIVGETPDPAATERAALSQKAGGLTVLYETVSALTYLQLELAHPTYAGSEAAHPTYEDAELHPEK